MKFGSVARVNPFKPTGKDPSGSFSRHSSGFDQFCAALQVPEGGMSVLDMSGASQANIVFLTSFGHRVSSDDIMAAMQQSFGDNFHENQQSASNAQRFLDQALAFPDNSFDGILVWDALQFLVPPLIDQVVAQFLPGQGAQQGNEHWPIVQKGARQTSVVLRFTGALLRGCSAHAP